MQQLENRFYTRKEIAGLLSVNLQDSRHFKRNIESKLSKWGYEYEYSRAGVQILQSPETPEDRLREVLIRDYGMDVQISAYNFACFICAFSEIDGFESMPWEERERMMYFHYGISVDERTLRNWCSRLIKQNDIVRCDEKTFWKTEFTSSGKERMRVDWDCEEMRRYFSRRAELLKEHGGEWEPVIKHLWSEFNCCYYSCKTFLLSAFDCQDENRLLEIYELTKEVAARQLAVDLIIKEPETKEDFYAQWFRS